MPLQSQQDRFDPAHFHGQRRNNTNRFRCGPVRCNKTPASRAAIARALARFSASSREVAKTSTTAHAPLPPIAILQPLQANNLANRLAIALQYTLHFPGSRPTRASSVLPGPIDRREDSRQRFPIQHLAPTYRATMLGRSPRKSARDLHQGSFQHQQIGTQP